MQIIPVIDIKAGHAVLANKGDRKDYQPLSTPLCASSQIDDVISAYLSIYSFTHFYIADLDALMGTGSNHTQINSLFAHYPQLNFMIDCGSLKTNYTPTQAKQFKPVIGTESINTQALKDIRQQRSDFILSLDFSAHNKLMGEAILYESPELWPKELIIMSLGLVGKSSGPDLEKLQYYYYTYPEHNFIAAGGIRNIEDLFQLKRIGIQQVLIASALHYGNLTSLDIQQLSHD